MEIKLSTTQLIGIGTIIGGLIGLAINNNLAAILIGIALIVVEKTRETALKSGKNNPLEVFNSDESIIKKERQSNKEWLME